MKSNLYFFLFVIFILPFTATAQSKQYQKLDGYYVTDKFDKCIDAAMGYTESDKTSKDPEPYLYCSMGFLGVYRNPDKYTMKKYPDYKDPLRKSLSYFAKFRKRDKTGEQMQSNSGFAEDLKGETIQFMNELLDKNDKTKMAAYSREIAKAFPDDGTMLLLSGTHLVLSGNVGDGLKTIDSSYKYLSADTTREYNETEAACLSKYFIL